MRLVTRCPPPPAELRANDGRAAVLARVHRSTAIKHDDLDLGSNNVGLDGVVVRRGDPGEQQRVVTGMEQANHVCPPVRMSLD